LLPPPPSLHFQAPAREARAPGARPSAHRPHPYPARHSPRIDLLSPYVTYGDVFSPFASCPYSVHPCARAGLFLIITGWSAELPVANRNSEVTFNSNLTQLTTRNYSAKTHDRISISKASVSCIFALVQHLDWGGCSMFLRISEPIGRCGLGMSMSTYPSLTSSLLLSPLV
jgi:hypothetical protein